MNGVPRVDQVGSLFRPARLRELFVRQMQGLASEQQLREAQDEAIREVFRQQEGLGLPVQTDGEFRRRNFIHSVADSAAGLERWKEAWRARFLAEYERRRDPTFSAPSPQLADAQPATERLRLTGNTPLEEYRWSSALSSQTVKITLVSPHRVAQCIDLAASKPIYDRLDEVLADAAAVVREMIVQLREAGCRYVQIDAPSYSAFLDPERREHLGAQGIHPSTLLETVIQAEQAAVRGIEGTSLGLHVCRGNRPGAKWATGPYDAIAEQLFPSVPHDRLLLEYDTERAGGFEPLRFVPQDKLVVLGVVSTKSAEIESVEQIKRRVDEAARYLPLEQLAISPQCGFSSDVGGPPISEEVQWRKLEVLLEAGRQIWAA